MRASHAAAKSHTRTTKARHASLSSAPKSLSASSSQRQCTQNCPAASSHRQVSMRRFSQNIIPQATIHSRVRKVSAMLLHKAAALALQATVLPADKASANTTLQAQSQDPLTPPLAPYNYVDPKHTNKQACRAMPQQQEARRGNAQLTQSNTCGRHAGGTWQRVAAAQASTCQQDAPTKAKLIRMRSSHLSLHSHRHSRHARPAA
jgi:hypothetical protein